MKADLDGQWRMRFPELFAPQYWEWAGFDARFGLEVPPDAEISNMHVMCRTDGGIVVCENDTGWRFLPGGTREPGEGIEETARRELVEEAGATLLSPLRWIGVFRCESRRPPWRPHLPHPVSYWAYAAADVEVDGVPTNPPDGEQVTEVLVLPIDRAVEWLGAPRDGGAADIVRLAVALGEC